MTSVPERRNAEVAAVMTALAAGAGPPEKRTATFLGGVAADMLSAVAPETLGRKGRGNDVRPPRPGQRRYLGKRRLRGRAADLAPRLRRAPRAEVETKCVA